jgi:hypothetical protein
VAGLAQGVAPDNEVEIKALEADRGNYLGYVRLVGRRQRQSKLLDQIVSLPAHYTKKPLLQSKEYNGADKAEPKPPPNRRQARRRAIRKPRRGGGR